MTSPTDAQVEAALLRCPCCDGLAHTESDDYGQHCVACLSCGLSSAWDRNINFTVAAWNRRGALTAISQPHPEGEAVAWGGQPTPLEAAATLRAYARKQNLWPNDNNFDDAASIIERLWPLYLHPAPDVAGLVEALCTTLNVTDEELLRIRNRCEGNDGNIEIWARMLQMLVDAVRQARAALTSMDRRA